jgi:two-component system cell cycle sensor histidine kinase/response regulator CckA
MSDRVTDLEDELAAVKAELERVRAELERERARIRRLECYRAAVETSPAGIMCVDGTTGGYVFANQAFADMIGHDLSTLLEKDSYAVWLEVTHPDDIELERRQVERLAYGEIDRSDHEKRMGPKGGPYRRVRVTATAARDAQGRLDCLTVQFIDVEEQHRAEAERERLEAELRQEQKLGALGKLAGGVAHDFNNRLLIIMGYTELMKRELAPGSVALQHAEMVQSSAERAAELTRQLLAYSRRQVLKPEAFDLNQTVDSMRRMLERLIGDDIVLETRLCAEHPIFSDPGQIEQVILNLALNARDAMPGGGRISLSTEDVTLERDNPLGLEPGEYVSLAVADNGSGIAPDVLPHIFEPFFTTKEVGRGTGLGLSMVEGIVKQSGGTTAVESELLRGSTFTVYLPRARARAPQEAPVKTAPNEPRPFETVLVCDDDEAVRRLLVDVLGFRAYNVLLAHDGRHALEVARAHAGPIHLLLTDLVMPGLGGVELAAELRKMHPELRVLYLSGYTERADVLTSELDPRTHFLAKPFLPRELRHTIARIVEGDVPPSQAPDRESAESERPPSREPGAGGSMA